MPPDGCVGLGAAVVLDMGKGIEGDPVPGGGFAWPEGMPPDGCVVPDAAVVLDIGKGMEDEAGPVATPVECNPLEYTLPGAVGLPIPVEFDVGNGGLAPGAPEAESAPLKEPGPVSAEEFDCGYGGVIVAVSDDPVGPMLDIGPLGWLLVKVCPSGPLGILEKETSPVALVTIVELGRGNGGGIDAEVVENPADNDPGAVGPDGPVDDVV